MSALNVTRNLSGWYILSLCVTVILSLPAMTLLLSLFHIEGQIWQHLLNTVLWEYISQSFLLLVGVSCFSVLLGVSNAWTIAQCQFPGRHTLEWLLLLPLAMPAYIVAYTYTGILDAAGPVQEFLRETFNLDYGDYWFPEIRSLSGAIFVLSLVLYPYVYLLTRAALLEQSQSLRDASRTLGANSWQIFIRIALPLARPAIVVGWSLVMMETLADYGTVQYFGVSTFTTGIFRTWFAMGEQMAAAQLSLFLLGFIAIILLLEQTSRRQKRYFQSGQMSSSSDRLSLNGLQSCCAILLALVPVLLGFFVPVYFLMDWAFLSYATVIDDEYLSIIWNTLMLASITAILAVVLAVLLAYSQRYLQKQSINSLLRIAGLGYAIPGTVIAVGVLIPFIWFDKLINTLTAKVFSYDVGLLLSGTVFILIFAYLVRFMSIALNSAMAAFDTIRMSLDESARLQGIRGASLIRRIHLPLLHSSLLSALLLVFVDVLKELPATLVLRPFNFNTLAVRAYEFANEERLLDASVPSLTIVLTGLIPVILLSRAMNKS